MKVADLRSILGQFRAQHGRADAGVVHLVAEWAEGVHEYKGDDVAVGWWGGRLTFNIGGHLIALPAVVGPPETIDPQTMAMKAWGLEKLALGAWIVTPSLHQPGSLHAYIVLRGVPVPAPFEAATLAPLLETPAGNGGGDAG